jgi:hypothetical protein
MPDMVARGLIGTAMAKTTSVRGFEEPNFARVVEELAEFELLQPVVAEVDFVGKSR